jgi:hypothetical protein
MGPDKAVSATSDLVIAEPSKPNLTGVWQSWNYNPDAPNLNYSEEKGQRFQRWLVSDADRAAPETLNYPAAPYTSDSIELVGKGSLGGLDDHSMKVNAGRGGGYLPHRPQRDNDLGLYRVPQRGGRHGHLQSLQRLAMAPEKWKPEFKEGRCPPLDVPSC